MGVVDLSHGHPDGAGRGYTGRTRRTATQFGLQRRPSCRDTATLEQLQARNDGLCIRLSDCWSQTKEISGAYGCIGWLSITLKYTHKKYTFRIG
jgi:hypothetical protein